MNANGRVSGRWRARVCSSAAGPGALWNVSGDITFSGLACLTIVQHHAWPLGGEMLIAPGEQRPQHRAKIPATLGQQVLVPRRSL